LVQKLGPVTEGWWVRDKEHGLQFKATTMKTVPPTTAEGIERLFHLMFRFPLLNCAEKNRCGREKVSLVGGTDFQLRMNQT
jgi:hypothetical protein